jgi:hypothetical protein
MLVSGGPHADLPGALKLICPVSRKMSSLTILSEDMPEDSWSLEVIRQV